MDERIVTELIDSCFVPAKNGHVEWKTVNDAVNAFNTLSHEFVGASTESYGSILWQMVGFVDTNDIAKNVVGNVDKLFELTEALRVKLAKVKGEVSAPRGNVFNVEATTKAIDKYFDLLYMELTNKPYMPVSDIATENKLALRYNCDRIMHMCFEGKKNRDVSKNDVKACFNCIDTYVRAMVQPKACEKSELKK